MPARTVDDDPYAALANPAKPAKRSAARTAQDDDPYAALADTSNPDPWKTPEGVKIVGTNAAGQPIYAPASQPETRGSAASRFLSSAYKTLVEPVKGMYHGLVEGPQSPEEAAVVNDPLAGGLVQGRINQVAKRFLIDPATHEARMTAEEFRQSDPWSLHPSEEALRHRQLALGLGLATVLPMVGPSAAQAGEQAGTQWAAGNRAGALGTGVGTVGQVLIPEAAKGIGRPIARGQVTRLIKPMAADVKFGKDPALAILDEGITGNTLEQIGDKVYTRLREVGRQVDREALKHSGQTQGITSPGAINPKVQTVDLQFALQPLNDAMLEAMQAGDRKLFNQLQGVKDELSHEWTQTTTPGGRVVLRRGQLRKMKMTPFEALQFKRMVGDRIRWTQEPPSGEVNKSLGNVYRQVKDSVNDAVPGLKKLNERYSNLVGAAKAVERRLPIEARGAHWSLSDIALGASGHVPLAVARHVLRWPGVRSRVAKGLYNLPRGAVAAPVIGAGSGHQRLRELQDEADKREPALAGATY